MSVRWRVAAAVLFLAGVALDAGAQRGGFGGVGGGGMRPTGSTSAGFNRAGTSSSGGFAYGDAPSRPEPQVKAGDGAIKPGPPCGTAPVTVGSTPYYKCGDRWYSPALAESGVVYAPVPAPPGY
ncbi:MAG TPA: hypothetical protein VMT02_06985 [Burkholderiales bacterium]|jgi:hypothetical protein|nr:hypothetical protein [Burkholderiales bacterium]